MESAAAVAGAADAGVAAVLQAVQQDLDADLALALQLQEEEELAAATGVRQFGPRVHVLGGTGSVDPLPGELAGRIAGESEVDTADATFRHGALSVEVNEELALKMALFESFSDFADRQEHTHLGHRAFKRRNPVLKAKVVPGVSRHGVASLDYDVDVAGSEDEKQEEHGERAASGRVPAAQPHVPVPRKHLLALYEAKEAATHGMSCYVALNVNQKQRKVLLLKRKPTSLRQFLDAASATFNVRGKKRLQRVFRPDGQEIATVEALLALHEAHQDALLLLSAGEDFIGKMAPGLAAPAAGGERLSAC